MILDGKEISNTILDNIKEEVSKIDQSCILAIVTIGDDPASRVYINNKKKACEKVGIKCIHLQYTRNHSYDSIRNGIVDLLKSNKIAGMIIQLPIISDVLTEFEKSLLTQDWIFNKYDVDGFHKDSPFTPCTPKGVLKLLESIPNFRYEGQTALVIGRSDIVGKPIAKLLLDRNCTVIQAHSKTPKERLLRMFSFADIVITAVGKPDLITFDECYQYWKDNRHDFYGAFENKKDRIIIDVGINRDENGKLCGDLSEDFKQHYSCYYTPVPGGVGPMTVAMLIENTWESYKRLYVNDSK